MGKNVLIVIFISCEFFFNVQISDAQTIHLRGKVLECGGGDLPFSTIIVKNQITHEIYFEALSDSNGYFEMQIDLKKENVIELAVRFTGYHEKTIDIRSDSMLNKDFEICLSRDYHLLSEVIVKRRLPVVNKNDTLIFNAGNYRTIETNRLEDLLKKIPGFSIANGIISFNGKVVEKLLLEGDDLAGNKYDFLSKNLHAILIDKIEIIPDYNEDKILGSVKPTGSVALNIELSNGLKNKINQNIDIGVATNQKYDFNLNVLQAKSKFKWFAKLGAKSTSLNEDEQFETAFETNSQNESIGYNDSYYLSSFSVPVSSFPSEYLKRKTDSDAGILVTGKINSKIKYSGQCKWYQYLNSAFSEEKYKYDYEKLLEWSVYKKVQLSTFKDNFESNFKFNYNDGEKNNLISHFGISERSQIENSFNFWTGSLQGEINDTILKKNLVFNFTLDYSRKLSKTTIFHGSISFSDNSPIEHLNSNSNFYSNLNIISAEWKSWSQFISRRINTFKTDIGIYGKYKKSSFSYGLKFENFSTGIVTKLIPSVASQRAFQLLMLDNSILSYFKYEKKYRRNYSSSIELYAGLAEKKYQYNHKEDFSYRISIQALKKISNLHSFKFKIAAQRELPNAYYFHPDTLLIGNGIIVNGSKAIVSNSSLSISFGLNGVNIIRQRSWNITSYIGNRFGDYKNSTSIYSGILIWDKFSANGFSYGVYGNVEYFIKPLKIKTNSAFSFAKTISEFSTFNVKGFNYRIQKRFEFTVNSGFKIPFNVEVKRSYDMSNISWNNVIMGNIIQKETFFGIKFQSSEKYFISVSYFLKKFQGQRSFCGLDAYAVYSLNKRLKISVRAHNLTDSRIYRNLNNDGLGTTVSEISLVGRYILFSMDLVF